MVMRVVNENFGQPKPNLTCDPSTIHTSSHTGLMQLTGEYSGSAVPDIVRNILSAARIDVGTLMNDDITRRKLLAGAGAVLATRAVTSDAAQAASSIEADLTALTVTEASRRLAAREITSVDLTRAYLQRIERLNPRINAYITVTGEQALAQAHELDAERAAGRTRGPLHGIPVALKDNIDTAGIRTTAASAVYADRVPDEDAPVVQKLRAAGAVFLGKLNMHEFAYGGTCVITHYGPVHNPWNLDYTPGGSSGGSAAAVAARLCAAALGTDTAASVRFPAACCGVVGLKATHGLASIRGIVPLSEMHDHVGPIARSVADTALVMDAIAGYDPLDPVSIRAAVPRMAEGIGRDVKTLRIGVPRKPFFDGLDPQIEVAVHAALDVLRGLTRSMVDVDLPNVDSYTVLSAETYQYHAKLIADPVKRALYDPITLGRIMGGANISSMDYIQSRRRMQLARNTVNQHFERVDLLITPTSMAPPVAIAAALAHVPDESGMIRNTLPFDVYGIPTISVPCGFTRTGLPIGVQISGPPLGEARVLALAHAYERATEWHTRMPLALA
jgi:aspartyl-tRNA(Asn)/glutamyl-tRNA(Gln) amidotransferase subunit A